MNNKKYFKLFANCIPVKGANRSVICDLQRRSIRFIPNLLFDIINDNKNKSIDEIKANYDNEYDEGIDTYFSALVEEEFGLWCEDPQRFPDLNMEWDFPGIISNAIIDVSPDLALDFESIISSLNDLGCQSLEIRAYKDMPLNVLDEYLSHTLRSRLKSIYVYWKYNPQQSEMEISNILSKHKRIISIKFHSAVESKELNLKNEDGQDVHAYLVAREITSEACCGNIREEYFTLNNSTFTEAQNFNSCLNRKIAIDVKGNIKNCPSMKDAYGNIKEITLTEATKHKDFKKYWAINKDQIDICKVCEYRYICTDCRAYTEDPENVFSKPLKCGYDPFTNEWKKWSTNPLKKASIEKYKQTPVH